MKKKKEVKKEFVQLFAKEKTEGAYTFTKDKSFTEKF